MTKKGIVLGDTGFIFLHPNRFGFLSDDPVGSKNSDGAFHSLKWGCSQGVVINIPVERENFRGFLEVGGSRRTTDEARRVQKNRPTLNGLSAPV